MCASVYVCSGVGCGRDEKRAPQDEKEFHKMKKKTFWGMCMGSFSSFGACRQTEQKGLRVRVRVGVSASASVSDSVSVRVTLIVRVVVRVRVIDFVLVSDLVSLAFA